jgi:hypothetical protein
VEWIHLADRDTIMNLRFYRSGELLVRLTDFKNLNNYSASRCLLVRNVQDICNCDKTEATTVA